MTTKKSLKDKLLKSIEQEWEKEDDDYLIKAFNDIFKEHQLPMSWILGEGELAKEQFDIYCYFTESRLHRTRQDITKRLIELKKLYE